MAFYGKSFSFDGVPGETYGLVIYNLGSYKQNDTFSFTTAGSLVEDRIEGRSSSLLYGIKKDKPIELSLVFGRTLDSDTDKPFDRWEQEEIASWLTDHNGFKWLEIDQKDMHDFRFKCIISELKSIAIDFNHWGFQCKVTCDSPYAYTYPETYTYKLTGEPVNINFFNRSSSNEPFPPFLTFIPSSPDFSITNHSCNDLKMELTKLPTASRYTISVDNLNEVISTNADPNFNIYENFNFTYLKLRRGINKLTLSGSGEMKFICEFPVNIGG